MGVIKDKSLALVQSPYVLEHYLIIEDWATGRQNYLTHTQHEPPPTPARSLPRSLVTLHMNYGSSLLFGPMHKSLHEHGQVQNSAVCLTTKNFPLTSSLLTPRGLHWIQNPPVHFRGCPRPSVCASLLLSLMCKGGLWIKTQDQSIRTHITYLSAAHTVWWVLCFVS